MSQSSKAAARPLGAAFLADYFCSWMGGANLLGFMFACAKRAAAMRGERLYLLLDARNLPAPMHASIEDFLPLTPEQMQCEGALRALLETAQPDVLIFYRDLNRTLQLLQVNVVGPTGSDLGRDFPVPWFAYVPDFQHQYLPQFFSQQERIARDARFRQLIENAAGVFVNSATVAADIGRFYPAAARCSMTVRIPQLLAPVAYSLGDGFEELRRRRNLRPRYVLSCSQRWLHKRHDLIVQAFARLAADWPDVDLVFTGETADWRDPDHGNRVEALIDRLGLRARVRILGMIPRDEQLALIDHALVLVQASMFEGGPGASGTLEAALLGTPIVASDIEPNRELPFGRRWLFEAGNVEALADAIARVLRSDHIDRAPPFDAAQAELLAAASGIQLLAALRAAAP